MRLIIVNTETGERVPNSPSRDVTDLTGRQIDKAEDDMRREYALGDDVEIKLVSE